MLVVQRWIDGPWASREGSRRRKLAIGSGGVQVDAGGYYEWLKRLSAETNNLNACDLNLAALGRREMGWESRNPP